MNIQLLFDFKGISQSKWEKAWLKCVEILNFFPVPLAMLYERSKKITGQELTYYAWSTQLISNKDTEKENLAFRSDYLSLEWSGVFRLYRNIAGYKDHPTSEKSIFWYEDEKSNFEWIAIDPRSIWNNGTSGAPYSLAVLALGIYLESRFPENCFMYGQYTEDLVERMRLWLAGILKKPVPVPICNDPDRLLNRLLSLYSEPDTTIDRFLSLNRLVLREAFAFLIEKGYNDALQKGLVHRLKYYSSPRQWGASDLLIPYLEAIRDVEAVIALVRKIQKEQEDEKFSLTDLLESFMDKGITIKLYDAGSETAREWNKINGLRTGMEQLNRVFMRMGGLPDKMNYYLPADKLLEIFACTEPVNGKEFQQIIEKRTKKLEKNYEQLEKITEKISEQDAVNGENTNSVSYDVSKKHLIRRYYLPSEEYILKEVEEQCYTFSLYKIEKETLEFAEQFGKMLFKYEQETGKPYRMASRKDAIDRLIRFISDREISLREIAWQHIENENDIDILTMLTVCASIKEYEINFSRWRKFIFESPELWPEMKLRFNLGYNNRQAP